MADQDALRHHLEELLGAESAHRSFEAAVDNFPPELRGRIPDGLPYSPWQLLEHVRISQKDILDFCVDEAYVELEWPTDYWPPSEAPATPDEWTDSIRSYRRDRERLMALLMNREIDLMARVPNGDGQTYLREFLLVADHTAYHTGQLILIRKLLGCWPPGK